MSKLLNYARSINMSEKEFRDEIERNHAAIVDSDLDKSPDGMVRQKTVFGQGHTLVVESYREFSN